MKNVTFTQFRKQASGLLTSVENGETLIILRHGKPVAEVSPVASQEGHVPSWRRPGLRLSVRGGSLSKAILEERERS